MNAALNGVRLTTIEADLAGGPPGVEIILAGDVFYDRQWAAGLTPWFGQLASEGTEILIGDPGRAYLPHERLEQLAAYDVPVTRALEDTDVKRVTVWRFRPH